jgi:hypothetical protein
MCGCAGDSLDYARYGYDRGKQEQKQMSILKKYYKPQAQTGGYLPFLKAENLDETGSVFTVTDVREATSQYSDIYVDVKNGREEFTVGMKGDAVICSQMVGLLGDNEQRWKGKKIRLYLAKGRYINAAEATSRPTARGKAKVQPKRKAAAKKR